MRLNIQTTIIGKKLRQITNPCSRVHVQVFDNVSNEMHRYILKKMYHDKTRVCCIQFPCHVFFSSCSPEDLWMKNTPNHKKTKDSSHTNNFGYKLNHCHFNILEISLRNLLHSFQVRSKLKITIFGNNWYEL